MELIIYVFAASFVFMAVALMITYRRTRHYGVFLLGLTYAASAVLAVVLMHWWPLVAGFAIVWVLRFLGLDPDVQKNDNEPTARQ
jgi:asparagine N-glycosylation enzyme membrane subunit Stt3